jgi:hypothetical protein
MSEFVTVTKTDQGHGPKKHSKLSYQPSTALDWDGPADPENPQNWPKWKQVYHMFVPSVLGFIAYVSFLFLHHLLMAG